MANMQTRKTLTERRLESQLRITRGNIRRQLSASAASPSLTQMRENEARLKGLLKEARVQRKGVTLPKRVEPKVYIVSVLVMTEVSVTADDEPTAQGIADDWATERLAYAIDKTDFYYLGHTVTRVEIDVDPGVL